MFANFVHLDFKGAIPALPEMKRFLRFLKDCGYDGVVLEYDDRVPWTTFPGTWRPGFTEEERQEIVAYCETVNLEVIPLIQIQGHLEWLLKHPQYHHLRENGVESELCPLHPEAKPLLKRWISEVRTKHPHSRYIHLGADETFFFGTCPQCRKLDKVRVYVEHVSAMCRHALDEGMIPIIWGDMLIRENRPDLASLLPKETVAIDWQYTGVPPFASTEKLAKCGFDVAFASAALPSCWEHSYRVGYDPQPSIKNVIGWRRYAEKEEKPVIVTTWGRPSDSWEIMPAWYDAVPQYISGGDPAKWEDHPWKPYIEKLSRIIERNHQNELRDAAKAADSLPVGNEMERYFIDYLKLSLEFQALHQEFTIAHFNQLSLDVVGAHVGVNRTNYRQNTVALYDALLSGLREWEKKMRAFWQARTLSDEAEFLESRSGILIFAASELRQKALQKLQEP